MEIDEIINSELANESEPMEVAEVSNESSFLLFAGSSVIENSMEIGDEEQKISNKKNKYDIAQNESNNECFFLGPKDTDNSIMQPDVEYSPSAPLSQHLRTLYPPERLAYGWVQKYKVNKRIAIKSLLEVILRSTGIHDPPLTITPQNVKNLTIDMFDDWIKKSGCQSYVQNKDYQQKIHVFFGSIIRNMMSDLQLLQMLQGLLQVMHNSLYMSARFSAIIFETSIP
ncbi:uncharacterized protein LOC124372454 [Homalodisca vitripennis]|uniref:uncharacterized protein LOC124372454 n=1 Tax=Homalodisca vitripennis TaxID=197043 RepID=UPI001EEA9901|nr:uncharacterized protein LOC124372454 [Homalodisca vitripennis]